YQEETGARRVAGRAGRRGLLSILLGKRRAGSRAGSGFRQYRNKAKPDAGAPNAATRERDAGADRFTTARSGFDDRKRPFEQRIRAEHLRLSAPTAAAPPPATIADAYTCATAD